MAMTVANLLARATALLQDSTNVRWPETELLNYLNDGQRQIVLQVPNANPVNDDITLAAGTKQAIPSDGIRLLDVVRNTSGNAVRRTERDTLDENNPGWHQETGVTAIKNWVFNPDDPKHFYVNPPATTSASLEIVYSASPDDATLVGNISLDDIYANALLDYILYRAYSKDAENSGNMSKAAGSYAAFNASLGNKLQTDVTSDPNADPPPRPKNTR